MITVLGQIEYSAGSVEVALAREEKQILKALWTKIVGINSSVVWTSFLLYLKTSSSPLALPSPVGLRKQSMWVEEALAQVQGTASISIV